MNARKMYGEAAEGIKNADNVLSAAKSNDRQTSSRSHE